MVRTRARNRIVDLDVAGSARAQALARTERYLRKRSRENGKTRIAGDSAPLDRATKIKRSPGAAERKKLNRQPPGATMSTARESLGRCRSTNSDPEHQ